MPRQASRQAGTHTVDRGRAESPREPINRRNSVPEGVYISPGREGGREKGMRGREERREESMRGREERREGRDEEQG